MAFQFTPDDLWLFEPSMDMLMDCQAEYFPSPFIDNMDVAEPNDYAQEYVLDQYSSLTPRLMQDGFVVDHPSENSSLSEGSSKVDNQQRKRTHDQSFSQQEKFECWLEDKDWYPTTQQKDDLSSERLGRSQVNGLMSRVRQAYIYSIKADKGSAGATSKDGLSGDHSGCAQEEKELYTLGAEVDNSDHDVRLEHHNGPLLEWWFKICLSQTGSQMADEGNAETMARDLQLLDSSHSSCSPGSSGDSLSRQHGSSDGSGSLLTTLSSGYRPSRRRGRRVCPGSRVSRLSSNQSTSSGVLFYCTFCDFTSDDCAIWIRHELEGHVQEPSWICQPSIRDVHNVEVCSFCGHDLKSPLCFHQAQTRRCWASNSRDFQRLEHLEGHLKRVHRLEKAHAKSVALEFRPTTFEMRAVDLTCYFCDETLRGHNFATWEERTNHVTNHYRTERRTKHEWDASKAASVSQRFF